MFYGILTSHPFVDGNKRTGVIVVDTFLKENAKGFIAEEDELWDIIHKVSTGKLKFEEVVNWIRENIK